MSFHALNNKVAVVTGAGRGQGKAIALELARAGADIGICDVPAAKMATVDYPLASGEELQAVADEIRALGRRVVAVPCDIQHTDQVESFRDTVLAEFGGIDILVNNAGILCSATPVHEVTEDEFVTMININLIGQWRVAKAIIPSMIGRGAGRIINIASAVSLVGSAGFAHYCAAKHGLLGLTKTMAAELAAHRITVNAICPGLVDTRMVAHAAEKVTRAMGVSEEEAYDALLSVHHVKERITPDQIAAAALYLAGDAASVVTGSSLVIDGGWTAT